MTDMPDKAQLLALAGAFLLAGCSPAAGDKADPSVSQILLAVLLTAFELIALLSACFIVKDFAFALAGREVG